MPIRIENLPQRVTVPRSSAAFDAYETLGALARPRLSTSPGFEEVAAEVRWRFENLGFEAQEMPFEFAPWVGRYVLSIGAVILLVGILIAGICLLGSVKAGAAVVLVLAGSAILVIALNFRRALHGAKWRRRTGTNLLFRRPGARPHYILMAHLDSKSQLVPLSLRAPAIGVAVITWLILLGISLLTVGRPVPQGVVFVTAVLGVLATTVLALSWADNDSQGALDNASGVATLLGVAHREHEADDVAYLVTDGEELGLAGARDVARKLPPVHGVINIDGIDDRGRFFVMERARDRHRGIAPHLAASILKGAVQLDVHAERRSVPMGILVDHLPIVDAGIPALTLMHGDVTSLNRVHRPQDNLTRLRGTGVAAAMDLLCAALAFLRKEEPRLS
ncbi:MAG: M28 family metallopeptidase [Longimicrobiales bacterium]